MPSKKPLLSFRVDQRMLDDMKKLYGFDVLYREAKGLRGISWNRWMVGEFLGFIEGKYKEQLEKFREMERRVKDQEEKERLEESERDLFGE